MARITCDDCLEHIDNRYDLVLVASKRARQLLSGEVRPLLTDDVSEESISERSDKEPIVALREIADGLVSEKTIADSRDASQAEDFKLDFDSISNSFKEIDRKVEQEKEEEELNKVLEQEVVEQKQSAEQQQSLLSQELDEVFDDVQLDEDELPEVDPDSGTFEDRPED